MFGFWITSEEGLTEQLIYTKLNTSYVMFDVIIKNIYG